MFKDILTDRSGRVIALARAVLAAVFLFAIWIDPNQPVQAADLTYATLGAYVGAAVLVAVLTWNHWWLDARLAGPAHVVDIGMFGLLVYATDGYTSPFFVFFVFLVLSAAIRWGWRQTALTALAVMVLYFVIGLTTANVTDPEFDLQRFIIRSGNLLILSLLLIWFGVTHGFSGRAATDNVLRDPSGGDVLESGVAQAAAATGASLALLVWRKASSGAIQLVTLRRGMLDQATVQSPIRPFAETPFLFEVKRDRALCRTAHQRLCFASARDLADIGLLADAGIDEGLALPVRTDAGRGMLYLGNIRSLCTDHLDLGHSLGAALARHIQRNALLTAVEEGAVARARLSLARDLHDSIVQFLAGATFRVEAISRSVRAGEKPQAELEDLKLLLLQEQQELRSAVGALRSERIALPRLAADLRALCDRLARQWDIRCSFFAQVGEASAPMRLHLDTHQLVREAVANAVRHASAKTVIVQLTDDDEDLRLDIGNDGGGNQRLVDGKPWSLRERVEEANGTLMLSTQAKGTNISITLPLREDNRA
ncbi:hypothetical protein H8M03_08080 [Sphingomonas sabuli]|uniref:Signal transduction histidine kinase subgroup 3 dimerisation and phosphoacceptor domain-containing protein n=1 Tax=Sphingomonas sabuli TaxID=2764186 RepID=A0A7G9L043_9SPHN|nr:histidine kinase [Sphingomonas sabuli]QNM81992.1 hypothetical protein H8M03_08080 [Sphingomonas sabuli]